MGAMRIASRTLGAALAVAVVSASCSSTSKPLSSPASSSGTPTSTAATAPSATPSGAGASWTTYFHDAGRSGVAADGPAEAASVHQQWSSPALDGKIYAEPLLVGSRVIVATENDSVYALNATSGAVLWSAHLGTPVSASSLPCGNVDPVGITSTPVVDLGTGRVYAAGMVQPAQHKLFALDLATGSVVASTGVDAPGADPSTHNQRGALALAGGNVLVPFGGRYGDCGTYHGRLVAVPLTANGFGTTSSYTLPSGREGGFWAPPGPAIAGDGGIYLASG
ncbi:MAG TPA: PQQ-binding-like beta-propeller repeat protein, partial [Acidimicrobiales bacterium]|nr:PQQ-binding-like beta-propeller repeat protein [Acidimicrobiales bacterium]